MVLSCGGNDATAPDTRLSLNTLALDVSLRAIESVLGFSGWASFRAMGNRVGSGSGLPAAGSSGGGSRGPAIPPDLLGVTLVPDATGDGYEIDPARTDAPGDGMRIVLVAEPGQDEVGFVEFKEVTPPTPELAVLTMVAVADNHVFMNILADALGGSPPDVLRAGGSSSLGNVSVELDYEARPVTGTDGRDLLLQMRLSEFDFEAVVEGSGSVDGEPGPQLSLDIRNLSDRIFVAPTWDGTSLNGTVMVNGRDIGTLDGSLLAPRIVAGAGSEATSAQAQAVTRVVALSLTFFSLYADLMGAPSTLMERAASG